MERTMDLSQSIGADGQYMICFRTVRRPDLRTEIDKFRPYGMKVRVDQEKLWVFLRSYNLDDIHRCIKELGDTYNFRPGFHRETFKRRDFSDTNQRADAVKQKNDDFVKQKNYDLHDTTEEIGLHEAVVMNLPQSFTTDRIRDICRLVYVTPVEVKKRVTRRGRPYCSVCVKSRDIVKKMCSTLNGVKYDDKYIIVKDANDLV